jgi:NAD(P)-dependent dehydrogenase (short-subunit alcohol dehydrogenase family)
VAVDVRGETNGEIVVEYCDMSSLKSVRDFCTKVLEQESRIHVLINHATVMWRPLERTPEGKTLLNRLQYMGRGSNNCLFFGSA